MVAGATLGLTYWWLVLVGVLRAPRTEPKQIDLDQFMGLAAIGSLAYAGYAALWLRLAGPIRLAVFAVPVSIVMAAIIASQA